MEKETAQGKLFKLVELQNKNVLEDKICKLLILISYILVGETKTGQNSC